MTYLERLNTQLCQYVNQIDYSQEDIGGINSLSMSMDAAVLFIQGDAARMMAIKAQENLRDAAVLLNHDDSQFIAADMLSVSAYWLGKAIKNA